MKTRFKGFVMPLLCLFLISTIFYSGYRSWKILNYDQNIVPETNYVTTKEKTIVVPTVATPTNIIRPYNNDSVVAEIPYYNYEGTDKEQQSALIYYENIYMPNTGVMYTSDEEFECISVLDGVVKEIKDDEIMGKIVKIENNKNITTIYQSIDEVSVNVNDSIKQGDVIGTSGNNKITGNDKYALHFEVYNKGEIMDPEQFYLLSLEDINE